MCFLVWGLLSVLVFPASVVCAGSCAKAERPPETRHDCVVFLDRLRPCCKNPLIVLEFAASSSLYDDAPIHATRGHPTARRLEQRRRGSTGEVVPAGTTRIAPARSPLHEPRARRPHPANHRHSQRSLPPAGR